MSLFNRKQKAGETGPMQNISADRNSIAAGYIDTVMQRPLTVYESVGRDEYLVRAAAVSSDRIETRRRGAGLTEEQLRRSLAVRSLVPTKLLKGFERGTFLVLTGPLGAGKSDIAEEWFRGRLDAANKDSAASVPVWLQTKDLDQPLEAEVSGEIGLQALEAIGCDVVVDGLDERPERAARIAGQAARFVKRWPKTRVLLTSREMPEQLLHGSFTDRVQIAAPDLTRRQADQIMSVVAGTNLGILGPQLEEALTRPLFAVLIARHASSIEGATGVPELIDLVISDIVAAEGYDIYTDLRALAVKSVQAGRPVDPASFTTTDVIARLKKSPLVSFDGKRCSFALATFEQWFAAKALLEQGIAAHDLLTSMESFDRWKYVFAIVLAAGEPSHADDVMSAIARWNPGAASWVIKETSRGGLTRTQADTSDEDWQRAGERIRMATAAWLDGLGPVLASAFTPVMDHGCIDLNEATVALEVDYLPRLSVAWVPSRQRSGQLPPVIETSQLPKSGWTIKTTERSTATNWVWEFTQKDLAGDLSEAFNMLFHRVAKEQPGVARDEIDDLAALWRARRDAERNPGVSGETENPLYPYPDIPATFEQPWGSSQVDTMYRRTTAVLMAAMKCYTEMSDVIAPRFGITLARRGLMPLEFFGDMHYAPSEARGDFDWGPREPGLRFVLKPLGASQEAGGPGMANRVSLTVNDDKRSESLMDDRDVLYDEFRQYLESRPEYAPFAGSFTVTTGGIGGGVLATRPATRIAWKWLWDDLKELGWVSGFPRNFD